MATYKDTDQILKAIADSGLIWETDECIDVIEVLAVKKIIDDAPKVTLEDIAYNMNNGAVSFRIRPKGIWNMREDGRKFCSNCCFTTGVSYKYCPECGADMRGE